MTPKPEDLLFRAHQVPGRVARATVSPKTGWEWSLLGACYRTVQPSPPDFAEDGGFFMPAFLRIGKRGLGGLHRKTGQPCTSFSQFVGRDFVLSSPFFFLLRSLLESPPLLPPSLSQPRLPRLPRPRPSLLLRQKRMPIPSPLPRLRPLRPRHPPLRRFRPSSSRRPRATRSPSTQPPPQPPSSATMS